MCVAQKNTLLKEMKLSKKLFHLFVVTNLTIFGFAASAVVDVVGLNPEAKMTEAGYDNEEPLLYDVFPDGFKWGVATAAYQVNPLLLSKSLTTSLGSKRRVFII